MSYRLYVRPVPPYLEAESAPAGQLYHWVLQDANGDTQAHGSGESRHSIEQVLAQNALEHVQLLGLVPGEDVLFCVADIPARQSRYIAQALPYAVEEQIAQDIDTVHLALGEPGPDGYRVAASMRVMRSGRHFAQFTVVGGISMFFGVIRPGGSQLSHHVDADGQCFYATAAGWR